jgi:hypothetical protein
MLDALFPNATAAVVKARKTSMTATMPVARFAPSSRLWIEIAIVADLKQIQQRRSNTLDVVTLTCCTSLTHPQARYFILKDL